MTVRVTSVTVNGAPLELLGPGFLDVALGHGWSLDVFLDSGHVDPGECHVVAAADDGTVYEGRAVASVHETSRPLAGNPTTTTVAFEGLGELAETHATG